MTLRLDGRVAVITGAGAGLGREHALLMARQGAKIVVNDLGGATDGTGGSSSAADAVVAEIKAAGGEAVANYDSVASEQGAKNLIDTAIKAFGRVDILVNNAGILRDKSFLKVSMDDFQAVVNVHYWGAVYCTKAAWPHMVEQQYGRVIFTTSIAGTSGNFGQANYGSAKEGMLGLMRVLSIEGAKYNILCNAISPGALTRMTSGLGMDEDFMAKLQPSLVSPAVAWLASERCDVASHIITAAAGGFGRVHYVETDGVQLDYRKPISVEDFDKHWAEIADLSKSKPTFPGADGRMNDRLARLG